MPAVARKILESDLIEKYHWLPQDIAKIPYKKLQEHLVIQKQKNLHLETKMASERAKNMSPQSNGRGRRFVREV